jgi:outer membrane lipoprotein-sorting protein
MMNRIRILAISALAAAAMALPAAAAGLADVYQKMDASATAFRQMKSEISRVSYTAILDDRTVEEGSMAIQKRGRNKLRALIAFTKPDSRTISFSGSKLEIFYPKINTVQEFDLGKNRRLLDQFLLLGFGSTSKELQKSYDIKLGGEEEINGKQTARLELTPKDAKAREYIKQVELWIALDSGIPVRQKFLQPSDDYSEVTYSSMKINSGVTDADLKLQLPAGVKREKPQK